MKYYYSLINFNTCANFCNLVYAAVWRCKMDRVRQYIKLYKVKLNTVILLFIYVTTYDSYCAVPSGHPR